MEGKFKIGDVVIGNVLNGYPITCQGRRAVVVDVNHATMIGLIRIKPYDSDCGRGEYNQFERCWGKDETFWVRESSFDLWVPELCDVSIMSLLQEGA